MSAPMTMPDFLKSVPTAASLSGLSVLLVNGSGEPHRASATSFTKRLNVSDLDLNAMGSEPGVSILVTSDTTLNLPPGESFGFVINVVFSEPHVFQVFFTFTTPSRIYTRCKDKGVWKAWRQLV